MRQRIFRKIAPERRRGVSPAASAVPWPGRLHAAQAHMLGDIVDQSGTAFLAVDAEGTLVIASPAARRLLGVGESDLGRSFHELAASHCPAELRSRIEEAQRTGRTSRLERQGHHQPPDEPVRLTIEVTPLEGPDGQRYATLLSLADSTHLFGLQHELAAAQESLETTVEELQSANEELRRREDEANTYQRNAESVLRSVECGIVVVDENARVRAWNR